MFCRYHRETRGVHDKAGGTTVKVRRHSVDHGGTDQGLAHRRRRAPAGAVAEQVLDRYLNNLEGEVVAIIPNVTPIPATFVNFLLIVEKVRSTKEKEAT